MTVLKRMQPVMLLQKYIYEKLKESGVHNDLQIYHKVPKDSELPYVFIGEFSSKFSKLSSLDLVHVDQKIQIYLRNYSLLYVFEIVDHLCLALECYNVAYDVINIKYIRCDSVEHEMLVDAKTLCIKVNIKTKLEILGSYGKEIINYPQS